ncbi:MAG: amidohydrolase family protein [Porticoccaceae bacterium]|jgi:N-acyl-D-aspartate/D-glutamate deacylase|nr:amidohydrolase family protein [Porticoccaceae bacterium]MDP5050900.1 amidohydrolase family protein [Porticoccaceae bacterium]
MTTQTYDTVIIGGRYFDGTGAASSVQNIGIKNGSIARVTTDTLSLEGNPRIIDAAGKWVTPGFLDTHTHYDAEVLVTPSLSESVRHGVTTVLVGSCSLSMICSDAEDASDIFTRVETVPREKVLPILKAKKTWSKPSEWVEYINKQPLGPNMISFIGHSDMRVAAMGIMDATDRKVKPSKEQMETMESQLEDALESGFLGLSTMRLHWDKIDGDRAWSRSLPSTYARVSELWRLNRMVRRYNRIHQGAPNAANPLRILEYLIDTIGIFRRPLKTTLIALFDLRGNRTLRPLSQLASRFVNSIGGAFRWQVLPTPFTVYADGIDVVFFEEFGAGELALDLKTQVERNDLFRDESYRRNFRKFYGEKLSPRVWQRDFGDAIILKCPDQSLEGKNFDEIARARSIHVVDLFLDLVMEFGRDLRWYTTVANDDKKVLRNMVKDDNILVTFSDAGAHIRNMAFYNLPLRFLKLVKEAADENSSMMSMEKAIWRMTGEQADWLGIDAGKIREGDRADLVVINPNCFDQNLEQVCWAEMENFDLQRLVNRNPGLVEHVFINGKIAVDNEQVVEALGHEQGYGRFLPALS